MGIVTGSNRPAAHGGRHSVIATLRERAVVLLIASAVAIAIAFTIALPSPVAADYDSECQNPTQIYNAANMPASLNLVATDRVLFESGTFTGSVNNQGAVICVAAPATYNPSNLNGFSRLFVRGVANLPALAAASGAELDNEGTVTFLGSINTNGTADVINRPTGTIVVLTPGFALGPAAVVTNLGTIDIRGAVNLNGSTVSNDGLITAVGPLTMSGSLTNAGRLVVESTVTVNSNSTLANTCRLESSGLINNGTTSNAGVITLGSGALLINGGAAMSQTSTAIAVGGNFTNNGSVSGAGQYLFSGATTNQGTFAGTSAADPIVFYDTTQSSGQIFDTQTGPVTNTIRQVVTPPDSSVCSVTPPTPTTTTSTSTTTSTTTTTYHHVHHDHVHHDHTSTTSTTTTTTTSTTSTTTTSTTTTTEPPTTTTTHHHHRTASHLHQQQHDVDHHHGVVVVDGSVDHRAGRFTDDRAGGTASAGPATDVVRASDGRSIGRQWRHPAADGWTFARSIAGDRCAVDHHRNGAGVHGPPPSPRRRLTSVVREVARDEVGQAVDSSAFTELRRPPAPRAPSGRPARGTPVAPRRSAGGRRRRRCGTPRGRSDR